MSVELVSTDDGWWIIEGEPGAYRLFEVQVVERASAERKHVLRRQVRTGEIVRSVRASETVGCPADLRGDG